MKYRNTVFSSFYYISLPLVLLVLSPMWCDELKYEELILPFKVLLSLWLFDGKLKIFHLNFHLTILV